LEEYGKIVDLEFAKSMESLRYQSYDLFAMIDLKVLPDTGTLTIPERRACSHARLYLLVDCQLPLESFIENLIAVSLAGVDWIQIRDKEADTGRIIEYGQAALAAIDPAKTQILINDRLDIAMAIGAAGVHMGQEDMPVKAARRVAPDSMWIGVSTHSLEQAIQAEAEGADYIGCGPTFPSTTKSFDQYKGTEWLKAVSQQIKIPAFAIGGVSATNIEVVTQAGIQRVAVSGAIWKAADPATSARQIREKL
jgi:thiamine-phosphate pyrophosphorylase